MLGRDFAENKITPSGSPQVAIITHGLWQTEFGEDRRVVGRSSTWTESQSRSSESCHVILSSHPLDTPSSGFRCIRVRTPLPVEACAGFVSLRT